MIEIENADPGRIGEVAQTLAVAFADDPVMRWLFPDEPGRTALLPALMGMFAEEGLDTDRVQVAEEQVAEQADGRVVGQAAGQVAGQVAGASVWCVRGASTPPRPDVEPPEPFLPYLERIGIIGELIAREHPMWERHLFLIVVGVLPAMRGHGLGGAMLEARLADTGGLPAYLEATSERNAALYARHGFRHTGTPIDLPDGPRMWPMWRDAS